jgi:hypothetical protein
MGLLLQPADGLTKARFSAGLREAYPSLLAFASTVGGTLRAGTRCPDDPLATISEETIDQPFGVAEGAVEITVATDSLTRLCNGVEEIGQLLDGLIDRVRSALAVGVAHHVLEPTEGSVFLALAFARFPGESVGEFRSWWLTQHAPVATRLLAPSLRGYDQVHVDRELSRQASASAGVAYHAFDGYDNLVWDSVDSFLTSVSRTDGRKEMYEDEIGHIDHSTYLGALMSVMP